MPEPNINLFNISRNEFKNGFINALLRLMEEHSMNARKNYYMIRCPEYSNLSYENINLSRLNMECTSIYHYWYLVNSFNGDDELLYNYEEIDSQVRDYIDYPEIRTLKLKRLKYDYREIVKLVMNDFNTFVIQIFPHQISEL